jgi:hypothetical protein
VVVLEEEELDADRGTVLARNGRAVPSKRTKPVSGQMERSQPSIIECASERRPPPRTFTCTCASSCRITRDEHHRARQGCPEEVGILVDVAHVGIDVWAGVEVEPVEEAGVVMLAERLYLRCYLEKGEPGHATEERTRTRSSVLGS